MTSIGSPSTVPLSSHPLPSQGDLPVANQKNDLRETSSLTSAADPACSCFESFLQVIKDFLSALFSCFFNTPLVDLGIEMESNPGKDLHLVIPALRPEELSVDHFRRAYKAAKQLVLKEGKTDALEALLAHRHLFIWKDGVSSLEHLKETAALIQQEVKTYVKEVLDYKENGKEITTLCLTKPNTIRFWKVIGKYAQNADQILASAIYQGKRTITQDDNLSTQPFIELIQTILDSQTNTINPSIAADFLEEAGDCALLRLPSLNVWIFKEIETILDLKRRYGPGNPNDWAARRYQFLSDALVMLANSGRVSLGLVDTQFTTYHSMAYLWINTRDEALLKRLYNTVPHLSEDLIQVQELGAAIRLFETSKHTWKFEDAAHNFSEDNEACIALKLIGNKFNPEIASAFPNSYSINPYLKNGLCARLSESWSYDWSDLSKEFSEISSLIRRITCPLEPKMRETLCKKITETFHSVHPTMLPDLNRLIADFYPFGLGENDNQILNRSSMTVLSLGINEPHLLGMGS